MKTTQKKSFEKRVISTVIVLLVLTLPVSVLPVNADNDTIRISAAQVQFFTNGTSIGFGDFIIYLLLLIIGSFFLGAIFAVLDNLIQKKTNIPKKVNLDQVMRYQSVTRERARRRRKTRNLRERSRQRLSEVRRRRDEKGKTLVENWRKSIVGLHKLADKNLAVAKKQMETENYRTAVTSASTSVENIARALIHCYGGKPEHGSGQEEPLRMLSNRFKGDEKTEFERAVDRMAHLSHSKSSLRDMSKHDGQVAFLDEIQAKQILDSASSIVHLFKRILTDHFAIEIPELQYEACPHCCSLDTLVLSFNQLTVNYQCKMCRCKWTGPRMNIERWM